MSEYSVKQGDTSPILYIGSTAMTTTAGWTCTLTVLDATETALITKNITETSEAEDKFKAYLTPAETASLPVETYRLFLELVNASLSPPFNLEQKHSLFVEPQMEASDIITLVRAENSFGLYADLIAQAGQMPLLEVIPDINRHAFKAALVSAYYNMTQVTVDFGLDADPRSLRSYEVADLDALTTEQSAILLRAQLIEADMILGANPIEDRRRSGLLSDSTGETAHFFRTTKPLELPIYKETALALQGYISWSRRVGRG